MASILILAVLVPLILGELTEHAPAIALRLTHLIASRLPETSRDIYSVEWQEEVKQATGKWWKLLYALGFLIKFWQVRSAAIERHAFLVSQSKERSVFLDQVSSIISIIPAEYCVSIERLFKITKLVTENISINEMDKMDLQLGSLVCSFPFELLICGEDDEVESRREIQQYLGWGKISPGMRCIHPSMIPDGVRDLLAFRYKYGWSYTPGPLIQPSRLSKILEICSFYESFTSNAWPNPEESHLIAIDNLRKIKIPSFPPDLIDKFEEIISKPIY